MRKNSIIGIIVISFLFFAGTAFGQATRTVNLEFQWNQATADTQPGGGLAGWKLYRSATAGGPYTSIATITYNGTPASVYTATESIPSPVGEERRWYFVLTAFDTAGNESAYSNEASALIDFKPPSTPTLFKVTIRVVPQ